MDVQEFAAQVEDLEKKLDRLRALYEQYFMGIEKIEPGVLRRAVDRQVQNLRRERCTNTAQRFRFQVLLQRYTTLGAYWQRICRAIEEGTYHPHILRAQRTVARPSQAPPGTAASPADAPELPELFELDVELEEPPAPVPEPPRRPSSMPPGPGVARARSLEELRRLLELAGTDSSPSPRSSIATELRPTVPPSAGAAAVADPAPLPAAAKRPAARPVEARPGPRTAADAPPSTASARPASGAVADDKVHTIHAAFAAAAKGAAAPSPAAIRQSLEKELARMTKKHPGKQVDFRVDLKDGKPVIKSFVS
jgi:hypothetical protein